MAAANDIAKAGWLHRQSSVLRRWKRSWFVLRTTGDLLFFENPDYPRAEERIVVRATVQRIKGDIEMAGTAPPEGGQKSCMFALAMKDGTDMVLCAESPDDMKAWQIALDEARVMAGPQPHPGGAPVVSYQVPSYPVTYQGIPGGQVLSTAPQPGSYVINTPTGTTTVVQPPTQVVYIDNDYGYYSPYRYRRCYRGGRYYGSPFMWGPLWW